MGIDLSVHSPRRLREVATELDDRPRKTLGGITPRTRCSAYCWTPDYPSLRRPPEFAEQLGTLQVSELTPVRVAVSPTREKAR
jgi:hypothetical protein